MKTKTNNKLNILLIATVLLLVFVMAFRWFNQTGAWLTVNEDITFVVDVKDISIIVTQDDGEGTRTIVNNGKIYTGVKVLEGDVRYDIEDVSITNTEAGNGYYIRCQVIAIVNGTEYNINNLVETDMYKNADGYMYHTASSSSPTATPMATGSTKDIIKAFTIPKTADTGLSIGNMQGKHVRFCLYIQGSPTGF